MNAKCPPSNKCSHGGKSEVEALESNSSRFPRYWFWEGDKWGCYRDSNKTGSFKHDSIDITACREGLELSDYEQPGYEDACEAKECFPEGNGTKHELKSSSFKCLWKQDDGSWGCYEPKSGPCYNDKDHKMFDLRRCNKGAKQRGLKDACKATECFHGGIGGPKEIDRANFPKCLWPESDGSWGCYKQINNSCAAINGRNMYDLRECNKAAGKTSRRCKTKSQLVQN
ncbi:hypothetical protein L0F63_001651 [Massospora cicadina]|nr:hypothetical protein L0F63_001651 [Massospora cicadina]